MNSALLSSKDMNWCTPPEFFAQLDHEFNFELDPAATAKSAKCPKFYTPEEDGLSHSWGGVQRFLQPAIRQADRRLGG